MESGAVSTQINTIWKRLGVYGNNMPPKRNVCTNIFRKSITTMIHDQDNEEIREPVAGLMAHSVKTASMIYRMRDQEKQAIKGSDAISEIVAKSKHDRREWEEEEVEKLKNTYDIQNSITMAQIKEKYHLLDLD